MEIERGSALICTVPTTDDASLLISVRICPSLSYHLYILRSILTDRRSQRAQLAQVNYEKLKKAHPLHSNTIFDVIDSSQQMSFILHYTMISVWMQVSPKNFSSESEWRLAGIQHTTYVYMWLLTSGIKLHHLPFGSSHMAFYGKLMNTETWTASFACSNDRVLEVLLSRTYSKYHALQ